MEEKMNVYDIKRLALVLAVQAEIEGMKIANLQRLDRDEAPAFNEGDFDDKAEELRVLASKHDHQL